MNGKINVSIQELSLTLIVGNIQIQVLVIPQADVNGVHAGKKDAGTILMKRIVPTQKTGEEIIVRGRQMGAIVKRIAAGAKTTERAVKML